MWKECRQQIRTANYVVVSIAIGVQAGTVSGRQTTSPSLAITRVTVIDTASGSAHPEMTVLIGGNRILEVGKSEAVTPPAGITVVDGRGKYVLPSLWDMHVHLFNNRDQVGTNNSEYFFPLLIANGILGVRDMWTDPEDIEVAGRWNREIEAGTLVGPRVTVSSRIVDGEPATHPNSLVVRTPDEGRDAVRSLKATGAGFIKVYWSLSRNTYFAIADESRRQNIPFEGHVPRSVTPGEASDAGQRTIEHMDGVNGACTAIEDRSRYDARRCEALADRLRKNGTWLVPTAVNFFDPSGVDLDSHRRYAPRQLGAWVRREPSDVGVLVHRAMRQVGRFLAGTDISIRRPRTVPGFSLHDELTLLVERGHTPAEALQAATVNPAKYLDKLDEFGTIETNKRADLLLLDADPLADIHNTSRISAVVLNGRLHDRGQLDRLLAKAESIAKTLSVPPEANVTFVITSRAGDPRFAGSWEAGLPNLPQALALEVEVRTTRLTGKLRAGGAKTSQTFEGTVKGNRLTFSLMSPDGDRTVTLTGDLAGDEILFTREVAVRPGGAPGGQGFFGVRGPNSFTARRMP
jgi:imidazolonepropionase-like amidohydrolase